MPYFRSVCLFTEDLSSLCFLKCFLFPSNIFSTLGAIFHYQHFLTACNQLPHCADNCMWVVLWVMKFNLWVLWTSHLELLSHSACMVVALWCLVWKLWDVWTFVQKRMAESIQDEKLYYLTIGMRYIEFMDMYLSVVISSIFPRTLNII